MVGTILAGLFITVVGGLILYHGFGVGKPSHQSRGVNNSKPTVTNDSISLSKDVKQRSAKLNPKVIIEQVDSQAPYLHKKTEESFVGLEVEWSLEFVSVLSEKDTIVHVAFLWDSSFPWVYFDVSLDDYPELKSMHKGTKAIISGTISEVSGHTIKLKSVKMKT